MKILLTGGAGYIGSHTCVELLDRGYEVVIVDNLSNASPKVVERIEQITGKKVVFYEADVRDEEKLTEIFRQHAFDACIHFAGLKAVGESVAAPLMYYQNNVAGTMTLCAVLSAFGCKKIIFSSSATVYGENAQIPMKEEHPRGRCTNPYGWTKSMVEQILTDLQQADPTWKVTLLRYFNPIGAHKSGMIGENPKGIPNNLLPYVAQVAVGRRECLQVFGNDYDTPDGTGVRDYIHVVDLAKGHVKALDKMLAADGDTGAVEIYNLGTGTGYSVLDVIAAFERAAGMKIPYEIKPRRSGDIDISYCDPGKAERELGWSCENDLDEMCADVWRWQKNNPDGYE